MLERFTASLGARAEAAVVEDGERLMRKLTEPGSRDARRKAEALIREIEGRAVDRDGGEEVVSTGGRTSADGSGGTESARFS